jgi:CBS domain-containing protein
MEVAMRLADILKQKGHRVVTVSEEQSVLDAIHTLVAENIGSLVVEEDGRLAGIFTERDVLRVTARRPGALERIQIGDVMTLSPVTATPTDELTRAMSLMTREKIRHLPVLEGGRLVGIVSIGDLLHACRSEAEQENSHLRQYIQGVG